MNKEEHEIRAIKKVLHFELDSYVSEDEMNVTPYGYDGIYDVNMNEFSGRLSKELQIKVTKLDEEDYSGSALLICTCGEYDTWEKLTICDTKWLWITLLW